MNFISLVFSLIRLNLFELNICEKFHLCELFMYYLSFFSFFFVKIPLNYQNFFIEFLIYHYFLNFCFMNAFFYRFQLPKSLSLDPFFIIIIMTNLPLIINHQKNLADLFLLIFLHYFESFVKILFPGLIIKLALYLKSFRS